MRLRINTIHNRTNKTYDFNSCLSVSKLAINVYSLKRNARHYVHMLQLVIVRSYGQLLCNETIAIQQNSCTGKRNIHVVSLEKTDNE